MQDKRKKENDERSNIDQQAVMWRIDKENWQAEEDRLRARMKNINGDNQNYLLTQMAEKKKNEAKMSSNEFQFNKQLLKEINQKLKTGSVINEGSNAGDY
jgi:hypothetical protein